MDETGVVGAFSDPNYVNQLIQSYQAPSSVNVPTTQPDFSSSTSSDPTAILRGATGAITSVAGAITQLTTAQSTAAVNSAIATQARALGLQQISDQAGISRLASATQLVQAQQAYNRAAGVGSISSSALVVVLAVVGVGIAALELWKRRG